MRQLTGWHVAALFTLGFGTIIAVNMTLAFNAVRSFPGLEVENSYVASQGFQENRNAQEALQWDVSAILEGEYLVLRIEREGESIEPEIVSAVFGRATSVVADQTPEFSFLNGAFIAPVLAGPGNWNLRLVARSQDGTRFQQRVIVEVKE